MDKKNYITDGYCQLNNDYHYEKLSEPIYPRTTIQITGILNKLKSTGAISEKQFQSLSPPQEPTFDIVICSLKFQKRLFVG